MDPLDLSIRFAYHQPTGTKGDSHAEARSRCLDLARIINDLGPDSREKSLAITALEECMMWTNAMIARHPEVP